MKIKAYGTLRLDAPRKIAVVLCALAPAMPAFAATTAATATATVAATPAASLHPGCGSFPAAKGDDATAALQKMMDACSASGGGRVSLSAGRYLIGPIRLASGVDLHLEKGAVLEAQPDHALYKSAYINWAFQPDEALISAVGVHDVAITGEGEIDGRGDTWWPEASADRKAGNPKTIAAGMPATNGLPRPWLIETYQARGITISGVHIKRAPMWNLVLRYTDDAQISNISIDNPIDAPNTDGIDLVAARNIVVSNSDISTGDDDIAIKSGLAGSKLPSQASENIDIDNIRIRQGHGLSVGSETLFGVRNVNATHISFDGTDNGIRIKSGRDRGNDLDNFRFSHVTMHNVKTAISVSSYYPKITEGDDPAQKITATTPFISNVTIEDLKATGITTAGLIAGLPEAPLTNISLKDVNIDAQKPLVVRNAGLSNSNVEIKAGGKALDLQKGANVTQPHIEAG